MGEGRPKAVYKAGDAAGPEGSYRVIRMLGAGGMGEVYEVEREGKRYAYKTLQFRHRHNGHVLSRSQAEAAAGQEMFHPNIARVFESGLDQHGGYLVMDLLRGQSLHEALHPPRELTTERILEIGVEVADALHALHLAKIVHRDVKPGNIFLTEDGRTVLLDLGAAKFERYGMNTTQSQGPIGTVLFMSPEHINPETMGAKTVDGRSDVYSLGHVLFYVLSGEFAVLFGREDGTPTQISLWHILTDAPSLRAPQPPARRLRRPPRPRPPPPRCLPPSRRPPARRPLRHPLATNRSAGPTPSSDPSAFENPCDVSICQANAPRPSARASARPRAPPRSVSP